MSALAQLIAGMEPDGEGWRGHIPPGWLQGRTSYGGLSAALALHVAQRAEQDLPPLRSAQVAFIGPLAGEVTLRARRLRRGRNAAFIEAEVSGEAGLGLRAIFVFMRAIPSAIAHSRATAPDTAPPGPDSPVWHGRPDLPFTERFETVRRTDGVGPAEWQSWVRLRDRAELDPFVGLVAVADALPPAALSLLDRPVPLSSMTWQIDLLTAAPATTDGWWLLQATTDHARDGSSSQVMRTWNADGVAIAEQLQSVAIFG